jgi:endonuclease/exonuclease/phosphatase family metal-dependent hydrolase
MVLLMMEGREIFLEEIQIKVLSSDLPLLLVGDFNMVRKTEEKSSGNADIHMMDAFNEMINLTAFKRVIEDW